MFKKLDFYLLRFFFITLLVVTLAIGFTIIVINMVEELRDFIDHQVPLLSILEYYLYFGGWVVKSFFPVFILLSTLFSVSMLARRNEILAMKASGISLYRIALPFLLISILLAFFHFNYNEYIYPPANKKRLEIKRFTIEKKSKDALTKIHNIYRQIRPGYFYTITSYNSVRQEGDDFRLYKSEGNQLSQIITSEKINYRDYVWRLENVIIRNFDDSAHELFTRQDTLTLFDIKDKPEDFTKRIGKPEDMGYDELKRYIELMKRTGGPYIREAIDLRIKYAYPLTSIIVVLISIPFASNPRRGGIAYSFAAGAMLALIYFVLFRMMQSAGYNEKIPQDVAVWGVNGVFFLAGLILLLKAKK
ncbi:MAG: LptF/LptG family permease [Candidatus Zixiibacteriota bacterium]